jgi:hypothetical protein
MRSAVYDRYGDKGTDAADIVAMSQDQIENQIEDYAREDALANNPDATEAEIGEYREQAAAEILNKARQMVENR